MGEAFYKIENEVLEFPKNPSPTGIPETDKEGKEIPVKHYTIFDIIEMCIRKAPDEGFTEKELKTRFSIFNAMQDGMLEIKEEKMGKEIIKKEYQAGQLLNLSLEGSKVLVQAVKDTQFKAFEKGIVTFLNTMGNLDIFIKNK